MFYKCISKNDLHSAFKQFFKLSELILAIPSITRTKLLCFEQDKYMLSFNSRIRKIDLTDLAINRKRNFIATEAETSLL